MVATRHNYIDSKTIIKTNFNDFIRIINDKCSIRHLDIIDNKKIPLYITTSRKYITLYDMYDNMEISFNDITYKFRINDFIFSDVRLILESIDKKNNYTYLVDNYKFIQLL